MNVRGREVVDFQDRLALQDFLGWPRGLHGVVQKDQSLGMLGHILHIMGC
jgi:hypothetical protein